MGKVYAVNRTVALCVEADHHQVTMGSDYRRGSSQANLPASPGSQSLLESLHRLSGQCH